MKLKRILTALTAGLALFYSSGALASPEYPSIIRDSEMMVDAEGFQCTPQCLLCHTDNSGGSGTANQLFSISLIELGLRGDDEDSLKQALAALKAASPAIDSDMDGRSDIDELTTPADFAADPNNGGAWDPNVVGPGAICADIPRYGCGAQFDQAPPQKKGYVLVGLCVAVVLLSRRRLRLLK